MIVETGHSLFLKQNLNGLGRYAWFNPLYSKMLVLLIEKEKEKNEKVLKMTSLDFRVENSFTLRIIFVDG